MRGNDFAAHWMPVSTLRFSAAATCVGTSFDSSIPTADVNLDAYTRIDLSGAWQVMDHVETYLAIDNATDDLYQQLAGFEPRGIVPRLGTKYSL